MDTLEQESIIYFDSIIAAIPITILSNGEKVLLGIINYYCNIRGIELTLTDEDLTKLIGSNLPSTKRLLKKLFDKNLISYEYKCVDKKKIRYILYNKYEVDLLLNKVNQ